MERGRGIERGREVERGRGVRRGCEICTTVTSNVSSQILSQLNL